MSATSHNAGTGRAGMTWPQMASLAFGAVYLLIGILGFFVTGFDDFLAHDTGEQLLGFAINPLHNIVHIVIGVAGLLLSRTLAGARTFGWLLAIGYGAAFVYGLLAMNAEWDFLNINAADNVLHIVSALAGLAIALGPVKDRVADRY